MSSPDTEIRLAVQRDGQTARVAVSDQGPGIPISSVPRLFEPFYRIIDGVRLNATSFAVHFRRRDDLGQPLQAVNAV